MTHDSPDEALAARAAAGERDAFLQLYNHYVTPIYRFVYFRVRTKELAEDIVSEVFLRAWKHRARFTPQAGGTYQSWLYTIARRRIIDVMRRQKPTASLDDIFDLGTHDNHSDPHIGKTLAKALCQLTPMQQDVLRLRFWHDLTYEEIAEVLGKSSQSCRAHGSRGLRALREQMPADMLMVLLFTSIF